MTRFRAPSAATRYALTCLLEAPAGMHGYDISRATGIKAGTLYPMLIRLAEQGHLEAAWQSAPENGRPPRHIYSLTETGRAFAWQLAREAARAATSSSGRIGKASA